MLLPTYSPKERHTITYLSKVAEGFGRLPREWKPFLTYHRVAWNVLSQDGKVRQCAGWQVQLIVWIFCCWQWKDQTNKIIEVSKCSELFFASVRGCSSSVVFISTTYVLQNWKNLVPVDGRSINKESISSADGEDNSDDEE